MEIPDSLLDCLVGYFILKRSPAFLLVDRDGCLLSWGGRLERYGIARLQAGEKIAEYLLFLEGLLPFDGPSGFLTSIQTDLGLLADLFIFSTSAGDWVLLLDATEQATERRAIAQRLNELELLIEKQQNPK